MQSSPTSDHERIDSSLSNSTEDSKLYAPTLLNTIPTTTYVSSFQPHDPHATAPSPNDEADAEAPDSSARIAEPADWKILQGIGLGGPTYGAPVSQSSLRKARRRIRTLKGRKKREIRYERRKAAAAATATATAGESKDHGAHTKPQNEYPRSGTGYWMVVAEELDAVVEEEVYEGWGLASPELEMGSYGGVL